MTITNVVLFSGGIGSYAAAKRVAQQHGTDGLVLLFTDTLIEDADLYRFIDEVAADVGGQLVRLAEGRTPWQVFRDKRFIGNNRADLCSRILKRELARRWIEEHTDPTTTTIHVGIDWTEAHRFERMAPRWEPWRIEAPMCERPYLTKPEMLYLLRAAHIEPPRLYTLGFPHNNCGGFCVKAGQAQFRHLLLALPERYAEHEAEEQAFRSAIGKDVAIMRDRRGGTSMPLPMREFRERVQQHGEQGTFDAFDWGGCGCFSDEAEEAVNV